MQTMKTSIRDVRSRSDGQHNTWEQFANHRPPAPTSRWFFAITTPLPLCSLVRYHVRLGCASIALPLVPPSLVCVAALVHGVQLATWSSGRGPSALRYTGQAYRAMRSKQRHDKITKCFLSISRTNRLATEQTETKKGRSRRDKHLHPPQFNS